jgi:hypothetical protein
MIIFRQTFGEDVSIHGKGWRKYHFHWVGLCLFMNEMDLNVNVFILFMKLGIFDYNNRKFQI